MSVAPQTITGRIPELFFENEDLFACPGCGNQVALSIDSVQCRHCEQTYPCDANGVPLLFCPNEGWTDRRDVTELVKAFYEDSPFPNYDDLDSRESLAAKASAGIFARLLDQQLPDRARVLEAGCGTGQLTNFLGMSWKRRVIGGDMCLHSLQLANDFRARFSIANAGFLQMNLFRPPFRPGAFDVVVCNGVLHHTGDPLRGFRALTRAVKPGGLILIGLYNHIGRLTTDLRRHMFRVFGNSINFLDAHMRNKRYNDARKQAWFNDQYKNPHESKHCFSEVLRWFESEGITFLSSIPKIDGSPFQPDERLFEPHPTGNRIHRFLTELEMLLSGGQDGALFIMIGRKAAN